MKNLRVTLVAITEFLGVPDDLHWETDTQVGTQKVIEFAGRCCYQSWRNPGKKSNAEYIRHLLESGHGSVLEHPNATFYIEGVSRALTHELVRHRAGFGFSQLSQRFVLESDADFIEPSAIAQDPEAHAAFAQAVEGSRQAYRELVQILEAKFAHISDATQRRKLVRGLARSVLPNATETRITVTANFRAWRHFIEARASEAADPEIRALAMEVFRLLREAAPAVFADYQVVTLPDGSEAVTTPYPKV